MDLMTAILRPCGLMKMNGDVEPIVGLPILHLLDSIFVNKQLKVVAKKGIVQVSSSFWFQG